jgi:hypothetical protein
MNVSDVNFYAGFLRGLDDNRSGKADGVPACRVYVNTGLQASIEALRANYPSVERLLGPESFRRLAGAYALNNPANDARLFLYGADLVTSLTRSDGEESLIAKLAQLDRFWTEAHAEFDAPLLTTDWILQQTGDVFDTLCIRPAPATRWLASAVIPLWDWWQALRQPQAEQWPTVGGGQAVLLTRLDDAVRVQPLPTAAVALLQACDAGDALPQALQAAARTHPTAELQHIFSTLFAAGAFQLPEQFITRAFQ